MVDKRFSDEVIMARYKEYLDQAINERASAHYTGADCIECPAVKACVKAYDIGCQFETMNLEELPCKVVPGQTMSATKAKGLYNGNGDRVFDVDRQTQHPDHANNGRIRIGVGQYRYNRLGLDWGDDY